jgi:hypothetical protein
MSAKQPKDQTAAMPDDIHQEDSTNDPFILGSLQAIALTICKICTLRSGSDFYSAQSV